MKRLLRSLGVFLRMIREFFTRQLKRITAGIKSAASLTGEAAKLAPKAVAAAAVSTKRPTKREDYIETKRLFISKPLIVIIILSVVAGSLLIYYIVWPWLLSTFFVARMPLADKRAQTYSGRVELYYDEPMKHIEFKGQLEKGSRTGQGTEYDEEGLLAYQGAFEKGERSGRGREYSSGNLVYEGDFAKGVREGQGMLFDINGNLLYEGAFSNGLKEGRGTEYSGGEIVYEGDYASDVRQGRGKEFNGGRLIYSGGWESGLRNGDGVEYYPNKNVKYKGNFVNGLYEGEGVSMDEGGAKVYEGSFSAGFYDGLGALYLPGDARKEGSFTAGALNGPMKWFKSGRLYYEGDAVLAEPHGRGIFYRADVPVYDGPVANGAVSGRELLGLSGEKARAVFAKADIAEHGDADGFKLINSAMGVTLFLNYLVDGTEPAVRRVYVYGGGSVLDTLVGVTADVLGQSVQSGEIKPVSAWAGSKSSEAGVGQPLGLGRTYYCQEFEYSDYYYRIWSETPDGEALLLEWEKKGGFPVPGGGGGPAEAADKRLKELLKKLGLYAGEPEEPTKENPGEQG